MTSFIVTFDADGAAFEGDPSREIGRILRVVTTRVEDGATMGACIDLNGNTVGAWALGSEEDVR